MTRRATPWLVLIGISFWIGKSRDLNDMPQ